MEALYVQIVRAVARGYERESEAGVDARLNEIMQGSIYKAARERDKTMTQHIGALTGGATQTARMGYDHLWNFGSVAGPS
jgi:hypothetical protein